MSEDKPSEFIQKIQSDIKLLTEDVKKAGENIKKDHVKRLIDICDKISQRIRFISVDEKRSLYSKIGKIEEHISKTHNILDRSYFYQLLNEFRYKASLRKARDFLKEYNALTKKENLKIEDCREIFQLILREQDLSKVYISSKNQLINNKNISILNCYDEAFIQQSRNKKLADFYFAEIKKFIDREAFRQFIIANYSHRQLKISHGRYYKGSIKNLKETLFSRKTLSNYKGKLSFLFSSKRIGFLKGYNQFVIDLFKKDYTQEFCHTYDSIMYNPFSSSLITWFDSLTLFGRCDNNGIYIDNKHVRELNKYIKANIVGGKNQYLSFSINEIPSFNEEIIKEKCKSGLRFINVHTYRLALERFTYSDINLFQRSALPQEKPVIASYPDHPEKRKPVIVAHPKHPDEGKPKITDHGKKPKTSLKLQIADRGQEQKDIQDMYHLPPSEALEDKTLSEILLTYSSIKTFPLLRKSTASLLSKSFVSLERLFSSYLPKFSFSTVTSLKRTKKPVYFKEAALNRNNVVSDGDSKKAKVRSRTIVNKKTVPVTKGDLLGRGGFVVTGIFIGLEVLHARLRNTGYKRAASFVPVTSNFRPWGEAYFSTIDYNLGVDPAAGYSTTRLFTHAADGTAYVFEGFGNILYLAGEAERFVYRSFLNEKTTGFDTDRLGIINGVGDAIGSFIDCMGGSLEIRRAKVQSDFKCNISGYEVPLQKKIRVSKFCINRGLSDFPKEIQIDRIKKISGTYAQTKSKISHSLLSDYRSPVRRLPYKRDILQNKNLLKVKEILKSNSCLRRYIKTDEKLFKKNVPLSNKFFSRLAQ